MSKIKSFALAIATITLVSSAAMASEQSPKSLKHEGNKKIAEACAKDNKKGTPEYKNCVKAEKAKAESEKAPKAQ